MGKTIAQELFAIAEAQGGTASGYPHTIAGAVDALTDALAGSDVDSGRTIAEAVAVMGEYIGGGGFGTANAVWLSQDDAVIEGTVLRAYSGDTLVSQAMLTELSSLTKIAAGLRCTLLCEAIYSLDGIEVAAVIQTDDADTPFTDFTAEIDPEYEVLVVSFVMPEISESCVLNFIVSDK